MSSTMTRWIRACLAGSALLCSLSLVAPAMAAKKGDKAADFEATSSEGGKLKFSSLRGKVVLLDFWASWCEPCKKELPVLAKLEKKLRAQGVEIVAVNIDNKNENAQAFLKSHKVDLSVLFDPTGAVAGKYDPPTMPTSYVIDREGVIREVNAGFEPGDEAKLEAQLLRLTR